MALSNHCAPLGLLLRWRALCQPAIGKFAPRVGIGLIALIGFTILILGPLPASAQTDEPQAVPDVPDKPTATAIYEGLVDLEWNDVHGAASYDVQAFRSDWFDLPGNGVELAFYGPGAIIEDLVPESRYYFRVRANNSLGSSEWSEHLLVNPTGGDFGNWDGVPEPTNSEATGAPTIRGTAQVDGTLTADTSGIADENGLDRVKFHYQWVSNDGTDESDIEGATESTYTVRSDDEGKTVKVQVSFIDRGGYPESGISAATEAVKPAQVPDSPRNLEVTNDENGELSLSWDAPTSDDGPAVTGYKVRWKSGNEEYDPSREAVVSSLSHTVRGLTNGVEYTVQVVAVNSAGEREGAEVTATPRDTSPPELLPARVNGSTIILFYDEALDANSTPATSTFSVLVSGTAREVSELSVSGSTVSLTLASAVTSDDTVALSYSALEDTGEQRVQDAAGNDARSFSDEPVANDTPLREQCSGGGNDPTPTPTEVGHVPIVVDSTTEEYFVLYARPDLDSDREIPVSVTPGQDGTTTLTEQLSALPRENYRVEKFLIADPGDIDGDCIDDITELADPVGMNPLNPAPDISFVDGAVAIPDRESFEALSYKGVSQFDPFLHDLEYVKFSILGMDTDRPAVYFINTETSQAHGNFYDNISLERDPLLRLEAMEGEIVYHPNVAAPGGSLGVYRYEFQPGNAYSFDAVAYAYEVLAASMPLLENNLAYYPMPARALPLYHEERALYDDSRVNVLLEEDILPDIDFVSLNQGEGYGFLRAISLEERPNPRDVVIYEVLPNELSRVAGIITTVPQTPLSHVNLRAVQDGVPNAFIRDALDDDALDDLIGGYVYYTVTESGYTIRAATPEEVDAHFAAARPSEAQTPERDLTVTQITPLSQVGFGDWDAFGVKAANVAVLGTLGFPDGTVPDGFAVPFYFYDEFMKHNNFYDDIEEMLADPEFQSDFETQEDELKKLRKKIKKGETPAWMTAALEGMHAAFPEGASLRYRSSTNNEDLPGFSGAGLYDSKTQHPEETEEDGIAKSLKQVYASLWNFRAVTEREFHRIDHLAAAMGVLVHPNYSDELANGVAVSFDPFFGTDGYYVNTQTGEDLVTNPDALSVPEEVLLHQPDSYDVLATSNQVPNGQLLMSDAQMDQLRRRLEVIHDEFAELYGIEAGEPFAMEIEFKITSDNILAIKQARPWVFSEAEDAPSGSNTPATGVPTITGIARVGWPLRVDTSGIADADGLTNPEFSYQWLRSDGTTDKEIVGATESQYYPVAADAGQTVVVRVSFADDQGSSETLTSAPTAEVAMLPLTVTYSEPAPHDGQTASTFTLWFSEEFKLSYKTLRDHAFTVDEGTVTRARRAHKGSDDLWTIHVQPDSTAAMTIVMPATVDCDAEGAICTEDGRPLSNRLEFTVAGPEEPPPNTPATGVPTIIGSVHVGETLEADTSGIDDADGLNNVVYTYQWLADDANISGATGDTYTLVADDAGKTIKVKVSFTDDWSHVGTKTSAATAAVAATLPTEPLHLAVTKGSQIQELDASWQAPSSDGGSEILLYHVQWKEATGSWDTAADVSIEGVVGTTYTITGLTGGVEYAVRVLALNREGFGPASYEATGTPAGGVSQQNVEPENNDPTGAPTISGAAQVGETLTADTSGIDDDDGLENAAFTYQWTRSDGTDTEIAGATDPSYTLVAEDEGKTIKVRVTFTDAQGNPETLTSDATGVVTAKPNTEATGAPTIDGVARVGETLTADTSGIDDDDGLTNVAFGYQWVRNDGSGDTNIQDATGSSYVLTEADEGKTIKVTVSFTDAEGNPETLTSDATRVVAAAETVPGRPQDLAGDASAQGIKLTWSAPSGSAVTQYVVYRGELENGSMNGRPMTEYATIDAAGEAMEYTDADVKAGVEYRYRVAAVNSAGEGKKSTWLDIEAGDSE